MFPDGQLYVDLRQATRVPHRLLRHLGVSEVPHAVDEAAALLRSRLADRAVLVVLDGATDPAPLRDLLPAAAAAAQIVQCCHGIPLALHIAGAILAHHPARSLARLARRLAPDQRRLAELSFGGESVRAACATAFSAVADPLGAAAFRLLGQYEVCDAATAATALGTGLLETEAALDQLVDLGLAEWGDGDTYRLPGLMRLFAAELGSATRITA